VAEVEFARVTDLSIWPVLLPLIEDAAKGSDLMTAESLFQDCALGRKQLWIGASKENGIEFVGLTEMVNHEQGRTLDIVVCVGSGRLRWLDKLAVVEQYALDQGCRRVRSFSRPGWRRDLAKRGYRHTHDVLEKEVGDGSV
jgi:hypothetical protein